MLAERRRYRGWHVAVAVLVGLLTSTATAAGDEAVAQPAEESTPALSITLESPEGEVSAGDELTYRASLANLGGDVFSGTVVVDAPDFVTIGGADGAEVSGTSAVWQMETPGGEQSVVEFTVTVGTIPDTLTRVTTLVSVYEPGSDSPIVRTAHAARIEGVEEVPGNGVTQAPPEDPGNVSSQGSVWWIVLIVGAVAVVGGAVWVSVVAVRRRRARSLGPRRRRHT